MYCPRCASQNADGTKFCRACGTDVETIRLVLAEQPSTAPKNSNETNQDLVIIEERLGKRAKAVRNAFQGVILLAAAFLLGIALALFSAKDDWIILWTVFFGWMAVWGIVSLALGIGAVMELRTLSRRSELTAPRSVSLTSRQLADAGDSIIRADASTTPELLPSPSVTEHTTKQLIKSPLTSEDN